MSIKLDGRYSKILKQQCIICEKRFKRGDEVDTAKTKRHNTICVHTQCWKDEQKLIRWQIENRQIS